MLRTAAAHAFALSVTGANAADLTPCFTPGEDCTALIIKQIDGAKRELLVQAYGFTSAPIISAIVAAKGRGVDVRVILDKTNRQARYTNRDGISLATARERRSPTMPSPRYTSMTLGK